MFPYVSGPVSAQHLLPPFKHAQPSVAWKGSVSVRGRRRPSTQTNTPVWPVRSRPLTCRADTRTANTEQPHVNAGVWPPRLSHPTLSDLSLHDNRKDPKDRCLASVCPIRTRAQLQSKRKLISTERAFLTLLTQNRAALSSSCRLRQVAPRRLCLPFLSHPGLQIIQSNAQNVLKIKPMQNNTSREKPQRDLYF